MDLLNRAYAQLNDLFRSMTPGSRVTAGLLLIVVILSMSYLFTHQVATADVDLLPGVPIARSQLANMQAVFHKANLKTFEIHDTSIRVRRGEEAAYMAALFDAKALPPDFSTALHDAINSGNMLTGNQQRVQQEKLGREDMLAQAIRLKLGAETACVTYDSEVKPGLAREKQFTALVSIRPARGARLDETQVLDIRYLVASAIFGLKPDNVTVADLSPNGRTWYGKLETNNDPNDKLYSAKRTREEDLKLKILDALRYIPDVTVGVNVELGSERSPAARTSGKRDVASAVRRDAAANVPQTAQGVTPASLQQNSSNVAAFVSAVLGDVQQRHTDATALPNMASDSATDIVEQEIPAFTPKQAKVLIGIPIGYFKKIWHDRFVEDGDKTPKTPDQAALNQIYQEQSAEIRKQVAQLLPSIEGISDPMEQVAVTTFDYPTAREPQSLAWQQVAWMWLQEHGGMAALVGLAVVSVLVLWSMVRTGAAEMRKASLIANATRAMEASAADDETADFIPVRHTRRGVTARRDDLSEVVLQDPNAAANILRTWVGNSG